ncbi:DUF2510 domain-containing protein [Microbacterium schleiferi]|uniref:DUF2510 domain-containing protein n=1 Tax=Microbacterium schleiferi TaxID=69362 RepID=A0A7S8RI28_9MICO|nr:DUF2510 domain-containing protein [Microbacterium schleiferi]QPE04982.1 DUF2510 domain-containing protein [Microbacterium schleiferi]
MSTPQQPPAGWYPDPMAPGILRFWDGTAWTAHTSAPTPAAQPAAATPAAPPTRPEPRKSPGVDTNTVWIWLIVLLPLASSLLALLVPWRSMLFFMHGWQFNTYTQPDHMPDLRLFMQPFDIFFSPWWWAITLFGFAIYGFSVWFAYLDQRELHSRGIDRPFPWPWMFLSIVYPIGRIVVAIRRTGTGWAPLWGLIAAQVVGIIVGVVVSAQITLATLQFLSTIARYGGYSG